MHPRGPYDLARQLNRFGGWPGYAPDPSAAALAFPVEGWAGSAAVIVRQPGTGTVTGEVHGAAGAGLAWEQALATLSLDVDGTGFPAVGERDPVMGRLLEAEGWLRPTLFLSPYEAACNFVIGQRTSMAQARRVRSRMAAERGDTIDVEGVLLNAFPRPQALLQMKTIPGLPAEKVERLQGLAAAALDGKLDRSRLRAMDSAAALADLSSLRGVGPFSAQGILFRGAGIVDEITEEPVSLLALQRLYSLDHLPKHSELLDFAEAWRPYRMWALVLLHVWIRHDGGGVAARHRRRASPKVKADSQESQRPER